jgi:hypothetical protein
MNKIDELIDISESMEPTSEGTLKKCYIIGNYALLKGYSNETELKETAERTQLLKAKGVRIVPVLDYQKILPEEKNEYNPKLYAYYILQEKVKGTELYKNKDKTSFIDEICSIAKEEQSFYDKFASDWLAVKNLGLEIDSKPRNFFYEKGKGINFIDNTYYRNRDNTAEKENSEVFDEMLKNLTNAYRFSLIFKDATPEEQKLLADKVKQITAKTRIAALNSGIKAKYTENTVIEETLLSAIGEQKQNKDNKGRFLGILKGVVKKR